MSNVERIYPEGKSALIKWIEDNFHEIDSYVTHFKLKNGEFMTIHHCDSALEAFGISGMGHATLVELSNTGQFTPKPRGDLDEKRT